MPRRGAGFRALALGGTIALLSAGAVIPAQAAPGDTSHAEGRFLSGSLFDLMDLDAIVGIDGETATSDGVTPETNSTNLDLGVLGLINVDIGGGIQLPIEFADAGVVGQYASAQTDASSIGASGLISDAGAIGTGVTPAPGVAPGPLTLDLAQLLGAEFAGTITDLDVTLGAISANAAVTAGAQPVGDYEIADATVVLDSPVVEGVTGTVNSAVADLDTAVDALAGPGGSLVGGVFAAVGSVLSAGGLGDASASVDVDLPAAVAPILAAPLDSGGGVVIDLAAGTITLDLEQLVGGLNGLDPSTELLSAAVLTEVTTQVADLIDGLVADIGTAVTTALNNAAVSIDVDVNALGLLPLVNVTVSGTLLEISQGTATVDITALGVLPISGLTDAVILGVLAPIVDAVINPSTGALGTLLTSLTTNVVNPVIDTLNPVIELLNTVLSLLANVQEPEPAVAGAVFEETALRLSLLPTTIVPQLLELNLAHALVGPNVVAPLAPVLTALSPDEGPVAGGTLVTVTGTDLAGVTGLTVDGVSVPFTQVSGTEVTFTTPAHAAGPVDVVVTTPGGASNALPFTFVPVPALTALSPDEGPVAGGTLVTVTGTGLAGATELTIDGASVPFTQVSATEISFTTPAHAAGPVDVVVTTPGGASNALPFTYIPVPALTALTPDSGPVAGGTIVSVTGTGLAGASVVTIDGASVPFTQVSDTEITFTTPAHAAGPVDVVVTTPGGVSGALPFTYVPAPAITTLAPDEGPAAGGTIVTITGTDLAGATSVTVDGVSVPFTQVSDTEITFTTPPHAAGAVDVVVTTPGGASNALPFTYLPGPALTALDPDLGPIAGGTPVTITGSGLAGATAVTIDGVSVPFTPVSATEITFTTPAHAAGAVDVVVTTPAGDSNALPFTFVPAPTLTTLDPNQGPTMGGTIVTMTGTALAGATAVTIDGVSVPFTQVSDTEIAFVTPAHAAGPVDVVVTTPGGVSNALPFTFVPAPVLTALSPDEGPVAGGTLVTVTGTDLAGVTGLTVDGVSVPFTQVSATEVTFTTPAHAAGPVDVVVTTPGGASNALPFTFVHDAGACRGSGGCGRHDAGRGEQRAAVHVRAGSCADGALA
ncbi:IPT/TIG domain-containing protein [Agromyces sp. Root81]|uniref:IPT/TIG domain-containing protein n=1 Tax=Agromyces sp. Root81 TaxID=1736601 RepID=UPI000AE10519|nr:IPT/TIG domain-containing protein [Agromyces sp. Root81]